MAQNRGSAFSSQHSAARVAVVGAGLAGLCAARRLAQAGVEVCVFEGSDRAGGRVRSLPDFFAPNLCVELGGEFIDSGHTATLSLARELGLELIDTQAPGEEQLRTAWRFAGRTRPEGEILRAFEPLAARIRADSASLSPNPSALAHSATDARLDRMSLADYLAAIGAKGWLLDLLLTAFATEYGLEAHEQSSLNLLSLLPPDGADGFRVFGDSDERYKVAGGNDQIPRAMAAEMGERLRFGHRLCAVRPRGRSGHGEGFSLDFGPKGVTDADFVVLAIPFTALREVDLALALPAAQRLAIETLGHGTGEKLIVGLDRAVWRSQGMDGGAFTDLLFQSGWDPGRRQSEAPAGAAYSFFVGGELGASFAKADPSSLADLGRRFSRDADALFPGFEAALTGSWIATEWAKSPWSRGSYSCYRPGQWTTVAGWEAAPAGNLHFAGEHCGGDFQGFMEGAVRSGRQAAESILSSLG
jgi:monoamine oxidase